MSEPVLADPQFGVARILRPYAGFEDVYQGQISTLELPFTPEGVVLDSQAGRAGYDPRLIRGMTVAYGQRVSLWLPNFLAAQPLTDGVYCWKIRWRFRNLFDYLNNVQRPQYHLAKQSDGVPDTTTPPAARVILPVARQGILFNQGEPGNLYEGVIQPLRLEVISPRREDQTTTFATATTLPLVAAGTTGIWQQGVFDPTVSPATAYDFLWTNIDFEAVGDELLISLFRRIRGGPQTNWNFDPGASDVAVSQLFGDGTGTAYPEIGVYGLPGVSS